MFDIYLLSEAQRCEDTLYSVLRKMNEGCRRDDDSLSPFRDELRQICHKMELLNARLQASLALQALQVYHPDAILSPLCGELESDLTIHKLRQLQTAHRNRQSCGQGAKSRPHEEQSENLSQK